MSIPTTSEGDQWPSRLAYTAAAIFTVASGATNLLYGWSKGNGDFGSSLVWAAVSVAVSVVFALSWPAVIRSVDQRQWSRAVMTLLALLLTGTYSVSAALGSAMGGRVNAATVEKTLTQSRTKAQTAYDNAERELAALPPARPSGEIEALIRAAATNPRAYRGCTSLNGSLGVSCPKLEAELARSRQRDKLKAAMDTASRELSTNLITPKLANSDAVALASYLEGLGVSLTVDRLNKLLVLLAVLIVECGGGLALVVGMALQQESPVATSLGASTQVTTETDDLEREVSGILDATKVAMDADCRSHQLIAFLRKRQGVFVGGQRALAVALGWSKSWTHNALHDLAREGLVQLSTGRTGTVVRLKAA